MSERTRPAAVELYARRLFDADAANQVIAVQVPAGRATIHLDTLMTMVDVDAFTADPSVCRLPTYTLIPADGGVRAEREAQLFGAVARALGLARVRVIETGGDAWAVRREQWDEANNVLAIEPGVVVGYERNVKTNHRLRQEGIEVLTFPGSELARGRGGARCMSCPIARDAVTR